jgi:hypothetical protein
MTWAPERVNLPQDQAKWLYRTKSQIPVLGTPINVNFGKKSGYSMSVAVRACCTAVIRIKGFVTHRFLGLPKMLALDAWKIEVTPKNFRVGTRKILSVIM